MERYTIQKSGEDIAQAITNALTLASTMTTVTISGISYNVLWEVAPTAANQVYGMAVHPVDGQLYRIYNNKGVYTAVAYTSAGLEATVTDTTLSLTKGN